MVKWHDGSSISAADFVMAIIMTFDRAYPDSPIYDESYVPLFESFQETFKGFRITSTDPLTVELYSDLYSSDAELNVGTLWPGSPAGLQGENSWEIFAISNLAEASRSCPSTWMSRLPGPPYRTRPRWVSTSQLMKPRPVMPI